MLQLVAKARDLFLEALPRSAKPSPSVEPGPGEPAGAAASAGAG